MRTLLAFSFAALTLAAPAAAATRNFGIDTFDKIRVEGPYSVTLATGVAPYARASGKPAALDSVSMDVEGHTLIVRANRASWGGYPGESKGPVEIAIGTHELTGAWLNGAGGLKIDRVKGLLFQLSVQGSGTASIGRADVEHSAVCRGLLDRLPEADRAEAVAAGEELAGALWNFLSGVEARATIN
jgi:hypothetical protein